MKQAKKCAKTRFSQSCMMTWCRQGVFGFLGLVLSVTSVYGQEALLPVKYQPIVRSFIDAAKNKDHQAIIKRIAYPLAQEYPIAAINGPQEMLARFDEVFDNPLLDAIAQSQPQQDWQAMGWRGIMLGNGKIWMDYDGNIIAVNHQTALEAKLASALIAKQKNTLHPSLKVYQRPVLMWQTDKFTIRIDQLDNGKYRYASWAKENSISEKPDLVLKNGELKFDGSGGNHTFQFQSGPYQYECRVMVVGASDSPPGVLMVYKKGTLIVEQPVLKVH
ncbi:MULTISPECIES: hypothetical protein [unclassified Serratia (in: enterobacteria)]|uniref:hypothetical protein n=1 Tax=unclassified Serratia (in: enterobacteria) TaxID=2647522 RepID=UPI0005060DDE|nr:MULTISPECIES: hypothetical protein [unclassified Serratia (in: enterobacteria)]KFK92860.1 hypothetical protein JV45_18940 [Serratia sp. Ag2]KFK94152.1 hypothetical protein IV04_22820 [Serratia sp. Ag1]